MYKFGFAFIVVSSLVAALGASPAAANDIDNRINFFLGQPNTVTLRSAPRRLSSGTAGDAPLVFRIPAGALMNVHTRRVPSHELQSRQNGMSAIYDDMPTPRQYPVASVFEDPTLRKGDLVVTDSGIRVFRGRVGDTHRLADFVRWQPNQGTKRERADIAALEKVINPVKSVQIATEAASRAVPGVIPIATLSVDKAILPPRTIISDRLSQGVRNVVLR